MKIKSRDNVLVIAGKDRGKTGRVTQVDRNKERVVVDGVHMVKRHKKAVGNKPGGIITSEAPIHVSTVKLICPNCQKATRIAHHKNKSGYKERICLKCKETVEQPLEITKK